MTDANPSFVLGALMSSKDNRFINNEYCTNYLQYLSCQHLSFSLVRLILDRRSAIIKFIQLGHQHNSIFRYLPTSKIDIKSVSVTRGVKKNDLQSRYAKLFSTIKSKLFLSILGYALSGWRKLYQKRCFLFNYPKRLNEILFFNYERSTVKSFLTFVLKRESLDNLVVLQGKISHKLIVLTIKKMHVFRLSKIGICPLNPGFLARNNLIYFDEILPLQRRNSKL